ncbi:hypothetical protein MNBD_PLANCTO02-841 [hydrothermal vent metagenome]|uniref:Zinc-finger domain-containing protein n=1 Tax=hydrothermal vent metagenome TaxID=652676 RepID=A0A3B1DXA4_9ZZZZ
MKCKQAKAFIALWVGNDLEQNSVGELERHVTVCPCCRTFWKNIEQTQQVLQQVDEPPFESTPSKLGSIWQELSQKIDHNEEQIQRERFRGGVPAMALIAACLFLLFYSHFHARSPDPVAVQPTFDRQESFSEATFPEINFSEATPPTSSYPFRVTPVRWADPSFSHAPSFSRKSSASSVYLPPFHFEYSLPPSQKEFKQTAELSFPRP